MATRLTVDQLAAVVDNPLDLSLFLQMTDGNASEAPVNFESLDKDTLADETESGNFLEDPVICRLVKDNGVLRLVLNLSLRPLLLLCGLAAAR